MGNSHGSLRYVVAYALPNEHNDIGEDVSMAENSHDSYLRQLFGFSSRKTAPRSHRDNLCGRQFPQSPAAYGGLHEVIREFEVLNSDDIEKGDAPLQIRPRERKLQPVVVADSKTEIDLRGRMILTLTPTMGKLFFLQNLDLSDNHLTFLPGSIGELNFLERLVLSGNSLQFIPGTIGNLQNLRYLDLERNQLKDLPESFCRLRRLRRVQLGHNLLSEIPESILSLPKLTFLCIKNNYELRVLPGRLCQMPRLQFIEAMGCDLMRAEEELLSFCNGQTMAGVPTLLEYCLRNRLVLKAIKDTPEPLLSKVVDSAKVCDFCKGPFIWHSVSRGRFIDKPTGRICLIYRMCRLHWNDDTSRVKTLFHNRADLVCKTDWLDALREDQRAKDIESGRTTAYNFTIMDTPEDHSTD